MRLSALLKKCLLFDYPDGYVKNKCGIAGILNHDHKPVQLNKLAKMLYAIRHRGPDRRGVVLFDSEPIDREAGVIKEL